MLLNIVLWFQAISITKPSDMCLLFNSGEKDSMIFDCTECYDPVTKQWTTVASMNHPRCGLGVCVCYGAIYALGNYAVQFKDI